MVIPTDGFDTWASVQVRRRGFGGLAMISGISGEGVSVNGLISALGSRPTGRPQHQHETSETKAAESTSPNKSELTDEERQQVEELKKRDAEVRRHEQAHKAAAGGHAKGGPSYSYQTGPDGRQYAVGGEVKIDTSEVSGDPDATIRKMRQIQRAANAPAEPSSQDRQVAAQAAAKLQAAQREKSAEQAETVAGGEANHAEESRQLGNAKEAHAQESQIQTAQANEAQGLGPAGGRSTENASNAAATQLLEGLQAQDGPKPGRFIDVAA
ncbi:MAG: hypothetical protein DHS20C16_20610 [Phycisphaerae bacterium]|nr:MAG: hypothetical protein DHS20C16_20610 [Phycisphaerae bacterium]